MALMLALARRLPEARDNQAKRVWRGMIGDLTQREDELGGKTLLIVGLGQIGGRLAQLAKAFDMRVIGIRRDPRAGAGHADCGWYGRIWRSARPSSPTDAAPSPSKYTAVDAPRRRQRWRWYRCRRSRDFTQHARARARRC
jgi:D-isomer specific 2-hydroxyacid dehydrogenase, NAD binding domain